MNTPNQTKTRKQLPVFGKIDKNFNILEIQKYCVAQGYSDYSKFNDIKYSSESKHQKFLLANSYSKNKFFTEDGADLLEGEKYKQLYLTDIDSSLALASESTLVKTSENIFSRTRRLDPQSSDYVPQADELNYNLRNHHVAGVFEEILNSFNSPVTRVRLAVLMPGFDIKPHVDYDPSYITRYHIPIFTSEKVVFGVKSVKGNIEFNMPSDGNVYFLNTGLLHWVANNGDVPRLHLIVDTHGQDDLNFE